MANPGSRQYDTERARLRKELEDRGVPDQRADVQANKVLQGEIARPEMENARPGRTSGRGGPDSKGGGA